jgi:hypothetical protein
LTTFTLPPFQEHLLPRLLATDNLIGGTFNAEPRALEKLFSQIFGSSSPWRLASDEVLVDYGEVKTAREPQQGVLACSFVAFRILVTREPASVAEPSPEDVSVVVTHLFVDQPWAMTYGREIFGFPALFAWFEPKPNGVEVFLEPNLDEAEDEAEAELDDETQRCAAVEEAPPAPERLPIVGLTWKTTSSSRLPDFWKTLQSKGGTGMIPFVQQKQMRDGLDATRACYQTLVEGRMTLLAIKRKVGGRTVELALAAPHLLDPTELGLAANATSERGYQTAHETVQVQVVSASQAPIVRSGRNGPALRQRRGDPQAAPAYEFTDVDIVGFRLRVPRDRLQRVCDVWLNDPFPNRSYRYVPAKVDLVVECLNYPFMRSDNPPPGVDPNVVTTQREVIFRMLVGRVGADGRALRAPAVFCPFLFVDSIPSMISGREVIGYPKLLAHFTSRGKRGQFDACKVEALPPGALGGQPQPLVTFDCRYDRTPPNVDLLFQPEARYRRGRPAPMPDVRVPSFFAWWDLAMLQSGGVDANAFIRPWLDGQTQGYAGLQVKRFPDAKDLRQECYHEIVECEYSLLEAEIFMPMHDATIHFDSADICGIADAFGFRPVERVPRGSWYRTRVDFSFRVSDPLA